MGRSKHTEVQIIAPLKRVEAGRAADIIIWPGDEKAYGKVLADDPLGR
jgi:hypothetical protein